MLYVFSEVRLAGSGKGREGGESVVEFRINGDRIPGNKRHGLQQVQKIAVRRVKNTLKKVLDYICICLYWTFSTHGHLFLYGFL